MGSNMHNRDNNHPCRRQIDFLLLWTLTNGFLLYALFPNHSQTNYHICQIYLFPYKIPQNKNHKSDVYFSNLVSTYQTSKSTAAGRYCARKFPFIPIITGTVSKDIVKHNVMIRNDWLAFCHHTIYLLLIYYLPSLLHIIRVDRSRTGLTKHHFFSIRWASFL